MTVLITGGAGFIGANLADHWAKLGERVRIFDDLSRPGVERNVAWLRERHHRRSLEVVRGDVREGLSVREAIRDVDHVVHLAAQVAVTTSLEDPVTDFGVNAAGTLNVLEAIRAQRRPPSLIFTSTNKVYGALEDVELRATDSRWEPIDPGVVARGVGEARPLSFRSPYGCSKGAADQYVLDWARTFGLRATVFRMSCIYGPRQFGTEDQGWVAHFLIRAQRGETVTVFGDGKQVRDVLFVADLVRAFALARREIDALSGRPFNLGGGPGQTLSVGELLGAIEALTGRPPAVRYCAPRQADQRWYVSDLRAFESLTGWSPTVAPAEGVRALASWLRRAGVPYPRRAEASA